MNIRLRKWGVALALVVLGGCGLGDSPSSAPSSTSTPAAPEATYSPPRNGYHFVSIGDWGTGWLAQRTLAKRMCELRRETSFDLIVTAGDNIYETGAPRDFKAKFFQPFACLLRNDVEFRSALGNHDIVTRNGRPELHEPRFGMNGRNYVVREGGVRFVIADSNDLRKRWMRNAIKPEQGDRWTIVVFHHPVYSSSSHHESTADFRHTLPPMFEKSGVDLVITGHTHVYAVTKSLHKIRYVTTGGGSASPHRCTPRWFTERCIVQYHFLSISAGTNKISVAAIGTSGATIDRFSTTGRD